MRSIFLHLTRTSREKVAVHLSSIADRVADDEWRYPSTTESVLYVGFYDDIHVEAEPIELQDLERALGSVPSVSIGVDVSGRVVGQVEVTEFAIALLSEFDGVAWDDSISRCWTASELRSGLRVDGHAFFDCSVS